jgi:hypothetical protein
VLLLLLGRGRRRTVRFIHFKLNNFDSVVEGVVVKDGTLALFSSLNKAAKYSFSAGVFPFVSECQASARYLYASLSRLRLPLCAHRGACRNRQILGVHQSLERMLLPKDACSTSKYSSKEKIPESKERAIQVDSKARRAASDGRGRGDDLKHRPQKIFLKKDKKYVGLIMENPLTLHLKYQQIKTGVTTQK